MKSKPFFVIGCVRSGTTFLRDVLRRHPNLASPEETHFYRWGEPFGTPALNRVLQNNKTLVRHRELDGISEELFKKLLKNSVSRSDLYRRYMRQFMNKNKPDAGRWFDKTPQNVYGAAMIASEFPGSKFIHIVRNPMSVVSSLKVGKVMHVPQIVGACNYWIESVEIMRVIRKAYPARVYEVRYEDLVGKFEIEFPKLLEFLGETYEPSNFSDVKLSLKEHRYDELFKEEELVQIKQLCGKLASNYGYEF